MRNRLERAIRIRSDWQSVVRGWKSWHVTRGYSLTGGSWPCTTGPLLFELPLLRLLFSIVHDYHTGPCKGGCERNRVSHPCRAVSIGVEQSRNTFVEVSTRWSYIQWDTPARESIFRALVVRSFYAHIVRVKRNVLKFSLAPQRDTVIAITLVKFRTNLVTHVEVTKY